MVQAGITAGGMASQTMRLQATRADGPMRVLPSASLNRARPDPFPRGGQPSTVPRPLRPGRELLPPSRRTPVVVQVTPQDPPWTLDQIAGLFFSFIMAAAYFSNTKLDEVIAKEQRKELGLCQRCGGLYEGEPTCPYADCPKRGQQPKA